MDKRRIIDTTRVVLSTGRPTHRGTGLGKVKQETWTLKKLREKFAEPLVDVGTPWSKYLKLQTIAKDPDHAKHRDATSQILEMKASAGNWTAARYEGKSRKASAIVAKTMLVLDIDHATEEQVLDIRAGLTPIREFYWLAHTSRSHCPEKPKFRLAVATTREMTPDECNAALRHLSTYLLDDPGESIEIVDTVTFRPNQTMFWPSISKGQAYWWDENLHGKILDVDEFLARHPGWEDFTNLPYQVGEKKQGLRDPNVKMEDPREKPEPIGAFCRTYSVEDAIEKFLPETYVPVEGASDNRWHYTKGSGVNGGLVYDDGLFFLSQHGSDPANGLNNAWDLVRLHKFGHMDEDAPENASPGSLPSYKEMVKLAQRDPDVAAEEFRRHDDVLDDLEEDDEDDDPADKLDDLDDDGDEEKETPWQANFRRKANGALEGAVSNAVLALCFDKRFVGRIGWDEFSLRPVCLKPIRDPRMPELPSPKVEPKDRKHGRVWGDADDMSAQIILSANNERGGYEVEMSMQNVRTAVLSAARKNPVHPVKDFIEGHHATWKKKGSPTGEMERVALDYLGCPDTLFHREAMRMFLIAAVARIYEPGIKFDSMLIIEGPTGSRKSTFLEVLFGGFCSDLDADLDDTGRLIENIRGWWCKEMAEMKVAKRADSNTLKRTLSATADIHRLAYAARVETYPRQNVFAGTSNEDDYLSDPTSSRRYWILKTPKTEHDPIDTDALQRRLWAIWGEAYQTYLNMRAEQPHGSLWLDLRDPEVQRERDQIAEGSRKATVTEIVAEVIEAWLDEPRPAEEVMVDESGMTVDEFEGDSSPMVRAMVTAETAYEQLRMHPLLQSYRNIDMRIFGKALRRVPGWREIGRVRRFGRPQAVWYGRAGTDGPEWVPEPVDLLS